MKKQRRRRFLVDSKVQYALGARVASHWVVFLVATLILTASLRIVANIEHSSLSEMLALAIREQMVSVVVILALLPWFTHDALSLSNRFAGPMVRLRAGLRLLAREDETHAIKFRSGDFWPEIADEFNLLRERVISERRELARLRKQLSAEGAEENGEPNPDAPSAKDICEETAVIPNIMTSAAASAQQLT